MLTWQFTSARIFPRCLQYRSELLSVPGIQEPILLLRNFYQIFFRALQ